MSIDYKVKVSGPGGCVNNPRSVIEKALREAGFEVEVDNECPEELTLDQEVEWAKQVNEKYPPNKVKITVDHWPWGG